MALQLNGSSTYIDCGTDALLLGDAFTVMGHVYHSGNDLNTLVSWDRGSNAPAIYTRVIGGSHRPLIFMGNTNYRYFLNPPPANQWSHVAFTVPGPLGTDILNAKYYLNFVEQTTSSTNSSGSSDSKVEFIIGNALARYGDDIIAEVSYWNRVLTQVEIAYYKDRKLTGAEQGLIGYWPMNDAGVGTSVPIKDLARGAESEILDGMDSLDGWSMSVEGTTPTLNTADQQRGVGCIDVGKDGIGGAIINLSKVAAFTLDGTGKSVKIRIKVVDLDDLASTAGIIYIGSTSPYGIASKFFNKADLNVGWNTLIYSLPDDFTWGDTDITVLNRMTVRFYAPTAESLIPHGNLSIDGYEFILDKGINNGTMNGFSGNPWRSGPPIILGRAA